MWIEVLILSRKARLFFAGAGPGNTELITKAALSVLKNADIVIFGHFINPNLLFYAKDSAEFIFVGKDDDTVFKRMATLEDEETVIWLTIGDSVFFSKSNRRIARVKQLGNIDIEIIPGIISAIAVPSYSGILISKPDCTDTVTVSVGKRVALGQINCPKKVGSPTIIFFLAIDNLHKLVEKMLDAGWKSDDKTAIIENGTTGSCREVFSNLGNIADDASRHDILEPALFVCGKEVENKNLLKWFNKKPLFSKRIIVTRPMPEGIKTAARLEQMGADVIYLPSIRLNPIDVKIKPLNRYDLIVFTSANSVIFFLKQMQESGQSAQAIRKIACIGMKTAETLEKYYLRSDVIPKEHNSAGLLNELIKIGIKDKRILIPGSTMMKPYLANKLRAKGADVEIVDLYKPEQNSIKWLEIIKNKINKWDKIKYLLLTSGFVAESVVNSFDDRDFLTSRVENTVAISKNVGKIAAELGFKRILVSRETTEESMLERLLK